MIKRILLSLSLLLICAITGQAFAQSAQGYTSKYFEIRKYYAHDGKLEDLIKRFNDHTFALFEKQGMENIAYFLPVENDDNSMTYILGYPDKASRDIMWDNFINDPEWQKAYAASTADGALVKTIEQTFMVFAPGLNELPKPMPSGVIQLRKYTMYDGKIYDIQRRFKDHTQALFDKQGLRNYPYWVTVEEDGSQSQLIYLLGHRDQVAFDSAFDAFRKDPDWIKARDASEASGKIVEKVDAEMFKTLPISPLK